MPKKKADPKPDSDLKEIQDWNKQIRERMKKAREATENASTSKKTRGDS